jgi:hypothetical protein
LLILSRLLGNLESANQHSHQPLLSTDPSKVPAKRGPYKKRGDQISN